MSWNPGASDDGRCGAVDSVTPEELVALGTLGPGYLLKWVVSLAAPATALVLTLPTQPRLPWPGGFSGCPHMSSNLPILAKSSTNLEVQRLSSRPASAPSWPRDLGQ